MRSPALNNWRIAGLAVALVLAGCSPKGADNTGGSNTAGNSRSGGSTNSSSNGSGGNANSGGSGGSQGGAKTGGNTNSNGGNTTSNGGDTTSNGGSTTSNGGSTTSGCASSASSSTATCTGVDLQTDGKNCGKCGNVCASNTCNAGVCKKVKDCFIKTVVTDPVVANFESYDGVTALDKWGWAFNAPAGSANAVYAGLYESNDGTGTPKMSVLGPGYNSSKYAANVSNPKASKYGGQMGMWMGCVDASAYQGVSFWAKGTVPNDKGTMTIATEATTAPDTTGFGGGTCTSGTCAPPSIEFPVTSTWSQVLVKWDSLKAGTGNGASVPTTAKDITGMSWNLNVNWASAGGDAGYVPVESSYDLTIDDVQFIGATACTGGQKLCGTGCVDSSTDLKNCGTCGNECKDSRTCTAGTCVCPSGYSDCNGECVDTKIDAQNCGGCGKACTGVCSAGACTASTCAADMAQKDKTSTAAATITLGKYFINNNQWGVSGATGSQSIWSTCTSGNTIGWGTEWTSWTGSAGQVKSYASAVLGWHWGWKLTGTGLPLQMSAGKNITCGWTYRVQAGQTIDISYDLFAHSKSDPGTNDDPSDEIMIWLYRSGGAAPIGDTTATVTIAGTSWELHKGSNGRWNVYSYVRTSNADTGTTLNLGDFLKDLTTNRGFSGSKYLNSIQAGTEVFLGTGRLDTDQYYCTIQ
jgi:hypothetical protein